MLTRGTALIGLAAALGCEFSTVGEAQTGTSGAGDGSSSQSPSTTLDDGATTDDSAASMTGGAGPSSSSAGDSEGASASATTGEEPTSTGAPTEDSTGPTTAGSESGTGGTPSCHPLIAEILPSNVGSDDGLEWAKLYNPCVDPADLSSLSLGWGGSAFGAAVDLQGMIAAGDCFVIGGPGSDATNFFPTYGQVFNYDPNLSRDPGAMLLYDVPAANADIRTVPIDSVVWGINEPGYLDPQGAVAEVATGNPAVEQSLQRVDEVTWMLGDPSPSACPSF